MREKERERVKKKEKEGVGRGERRKRKKWTINVGFSGQVREWRAVSQAASRQHVGQ